MGISMELAEKIIKLLLDLYADQEHIKIEYEIERKDRTSIGGDFMGGKGSGRKPKRETIADFRPARKQVESPKPEIRMYSVPEHVEEVKTSSGCRFKG